MSRSRLGGPSQVPEETSIAQSTPPSRSMDKLEYEYCRAMVWAQVYAASVSLLAHPEVTADKAVREFEERFHERT